MNSRVDVLPAPAANTSPLWAAVGVLGVAVLAMGASLIYVQTRAPDGHAAFAAMAPAITSESAAVPLAKVAVPESLAVQEDLVAPAKPAVVAIKPPPPRVAKPTPAVPAAGPVTTATAPAPMPLPMPIATAAPAAEATPEQGAVSAGAGMTTTGAPSVVTDAGLVASQPVATVAKPICVNCGTIESATPVQRKGSTSGVGTVAGGVLGAVVGNQIGRGGGRAIATILGAIGGGFAGNAIEKNVKNETGYQVRVRMDDGGMRTFEQAALPAVGAKVTVDGGVLHLVDGNYAGAPVAKPQPPTQSPMPAAPGVNRS